MKFRIGYLSDAFCEGRSKDFFPVFFTVFNPHRFEVYGYHTGPVDSITEFFFTGKGCWRNLSECSPAAAAWQIKKDRLDLLVNLSQGETPTAIQRILDLCKGIQIFHDPQEKWCYTPFVRDPDYVVSTPMLDSGKLTFGVVGGVAFDQAESFAEVVAGLLAELPQSRLLLTPQAAAAFRQPFCLAVLRRLGIQENRLVCLAEGQCSYDRLDIALGLSGLKVYDICQLAEHGIPVVLLAGQEAQNLEWTVQQLRQECYYTATPKDYFQAALNLARNSAELCRRHQLLRWWLHDSALMDVDGYMIMREHQYDQYIFTQQKHHRESVLLRQLEEAQVQKKWEDFIYVAAELDASYEIPKEKLLLTAWASFFLNDYTRMFYWAKQAMACGASKRPTQFYLMGKALAVTTRWQELWNLCQQAFSSNEDPEKMMPEVQLSLLMLYAAMAYRLGKPEMTELYRQTMEKTKSFEDYCSFFSSWLMTYNSMDIPAREVYEKHCQFNTLFSNIRPYSHKKRPKKKKLRIGYISPDFRTHVMNHFCWPFFATYDRDSFEVYVYSLGKTDQYTDAFRKLVTKWRDIKGYEFAKIAARIYEDHVDILIDLAGHTSNSGLPVLAWKPAPVQVSGLGYMTTTGLQAVDYFFTDRYVDPEGMNDDCFSEKLLRLSSQFCYNGITNLPVSRGTPARKRGWVLFGVFNQYTKVNDEMLQVWYEILQRVPKSKLLLKGPAFSDTKTVLAAFQRLERLGFDMNRVFFEAASKNYMERYLDVDIALDTYPYPGGGTTCDALYMGVPVITRYNDRHSVRFSYGILSVIGMSELASRTTKGYIEKAAALAGDIDLLDGLHCNLRAIMQGSPLMDDTGYIQEVEGFYRQIWREYEAQYDG